MGSAVWKKVWCRTEGVGSSTLAKILSIRCSTLHLCLGVPQPCLVLHLSVPGWEKIAESTVEKSLSC